MLFGLSVQFVYLYEKHLILPTVRSEGYYFVLRESLKVGSGSLIMLCLVPVPTIASQCSALVLPSE